MGEKKGTWRKWRGKGWGRMEIREMDGGLSRQHVMVMSIFLAMSVYSGALLHSPGCSFFCTALSCGSGMVPMFADISCVFGAIKIAAGC